MALSDFRLLRWLIADVNSVFGMLPYVIVGDTVDVPEVSTAIMFGAEGSMYVQNVDNIAQNHRAQQNVINLIY